MFKNLEGARVGLFIFAGTVILFIAIFLIGNKDSLFSKTVNIKTYFTTVEGLREGASVRLSGLNVGSVSKISLIKKREKENNVLVEMHIEEDVMHFIRLNSTAKIETEGLVGAKIVTISPGDNDHEIVQEGGLIKSESPVNMAEIIKESQEVIGNIENLSKDFADIFHKVNSGEGTIGLLINDDKLYKSTVAITQSADTSLNTITTKMKEVADVFTDVGSGVDGILKNFDSGITDMRNLIANLQKGEGSIGSLISKSDVYDSVMVVMKYMTKTAADAKKSATSLVESMEALKHNWLFKSYFEQRGYWDKADFEKEIDTKLIKLKKQEEQIDIKTKELEDLKETIKKLKNS